MSEISESDVPLIDAFVAALSAVPDTTAHVVAREGSSEAQARIDYLVEAKVAGKSLVILVEAKQTAFPRDVREAIWQLRAYQSHRSMNTRSQTLGFIIAEAISPGARETLRAEGIGYFDKGGSLYVPASGAYVFIDRPQAKSKARALGAIFHGRKAQVLHAVFDRRDEWVSVKDIAESSGVSPATASKTLTELERRDWMQSRGTGPAKLRRLSDASAMVDAWARYVSAQKAPRPRRYFVPAREGDLTQRLAEVCDTHGVTYAITAEAAAQIYAPYLSNVSQVSCRLPAGPGIKDALDALDARPVDDGWNLAVLESKSPADFAHGQTLDDVRLASPLQVYLDLQSGPGRAKELADHLRQERLGV
jgi:hypothetical protein